MKELTMLRDFPLINGESNCTRDREKREWNVLKEVLLNSKL